MVVNKWKTKSQLMRSGVQRTLRIHSAEMSQFMDIAASKTKVAANVRADLEDRTDVNVKDVCSIMIQPRLIGYRTL